MTENIILIFFAEFKVQRAIVVLHEILSLTMERRLTSDKLDIFHNEYRLPCKLLLCLVKNHGRARSTIFLKEAYENCKTVSITYNISLQKHEKFVLIDLGA
jgi:hypothetical protein